MPRPIHAVDAVDLRPHLLQLDLDLGPQARIADQLHFRRDESVGDLLQPALRHPVGGRRVRGGVLMSRDGERLAGAVLLGPLVALPSCGLRFANDLLTRLRIPPVHRDFLDLGECVDPDLDLLEPVARRDHHLRAGGRGGDDDLLAVEPDPVAVLLRDPTQQDGVGDVGLEDVTLAARRSLSGEAMIARDVLHDLVVVDVVERSRRRREGESVQAFVADDVQRRRNVAAEARLEANHLAVEDAAEPRPEAEIDLDRRPALELPPVDQLQRGIVEGYLAAAEQLAVEIHVDGDEPRFLVEREAGPVHEDVAIRHVAR